VKEFAGSLPSDGHQVHHKGKAKEGLVLWIPTQTQRTFLGVSLHRDFLFIWYGDSV